MAAGWPGAVSAAHWRSGGLPDVLPPRAPPVSRACLCATCQSWPRGWMLRDVAGYAKSSRQPVVPLVGSRLTQIPWPNLPKPQRVWSNVPKIGPTIAAFPPYSRTRILPEIPNTQLWKHTLRWDLLTAVNSVIANAFHDSEAARQDRAEYWWFFMRAQVLAVHGCTRHRHLDDNWGGSRTPWCIEPDISFN